MTVGRGSHAKPSTTCSEQESKRQEEDTRDNGHCVWRRSRPKKLEKFKDIFEKATQKWPKFSGGVKPGHLEEGEGAKKGEKFIMG